MLKRYLYTICFIFLAGFILLCCAGEKGESDVVGSSDHADLVSLFKEFREFQKPKITNGVPDYTAAAMEEQRQELKKFQSRLAAIDPSGWPIEQRVDYHLVRGEMNGLEFDHRVLRPWSRDPGFYITVSFKFGPSMYGSLRIPKLPLPEDRIDEFVMKLEAVPVILEQAKGNLIEGAKDLAIIAIKEKGKEIAIFDDLVKQLAEYHPALVPYAERARVAVEGFRDWLKTNIDRLTAPAGIGKENFDWYMKNVHLLPYSWEEIWAISRREYERAISTLKLEEHRNRRLPLLNPVKTEEEFNQRWAESEDYLLRFIKEEEIFTVPDYLVTIGPQPYATWAENPGRKGPIPDFFEQLGDRDPLTEIIHNTTGHNFDSLRSQKDKRPIRGIRRLYYMDMVRDEAVAFGLEEMLMHAGLFDNRRRGREIVDIALAFRAARAMADLKMHSNEFTFLDAIKNTAKWTPYGWALEDSDTMWHDMEIPLRLPGSAMGYFMGKVQLEKLLAERAMQLGDKFSLCEFFDEFFSAGMIPLALTRWEMTDFEDEIKKLW